MPSYGVFQDIVPGPLSVQGNLSTSGSFTITAVQDNLTAKAGGGQSTTGTSVLSPTTQFARVTTCATIGDSITLPAAALGEDIVVFNGGAASMNLFPATGDAIGTGSANAAFAVGAGKGVYLFAVAAGRWLPVLSA